ILAWGRGGTRSNTR
nr:Chain D, AtRing1a distal binding site [Arabidopsis thaliana]5XVW_F Chain F, AtRing1a distal binding site [Arabidopsis thaliana]